MKKFKRILFKISGEALKGEDGNTYDVIAVQNVAKEIKKLYDLGIQVCVVIGGGNLFRGATAKAELLDRVNADYIGMLATVMNGMVLKGALDKMSVPVKMQSAIEMDRVCDSYTNRKALQYLEEGRILLFVGGTGNPFFSTDTASVLRASEMGCDAVFKGTKVDGVYDKDPMQFEDAKRFDKLDYDFVIKNNLKIMDLTAFTLAKDSNMPIVVFKVTEEDSVLKVINGEGKYTIISNEI